MVGALLFSLFSGSSTGLALGDVDLLAGSLRASKPMARAMEARIQHLVDDADPELAADSLQIVVPLADRLGLHDQRAQLEDASFRALQPEVFAQLSGQLPSPEADQQALATVTKTLEGLLENIDGAVVTSRVKTVYGLHAKMQRKDLPLHAIADRLAVRTRVDDQATCYRLLDALHESFTPVEGEFDDYILHPKGSGYQSLHTAVYVPGHRSPVEIQLRTHEMHEAAEHGPAAHWRYKIAAA